MILMKVLPRRIRLTDPAMPAPSGTHSNFINPTNMQTEGLVVVITCLTASIFVVSMRMWTKTRVLRKMVVEDWICCLAMVVFAPLCALALVSLHHGYGVHLWNVQVKDLVASLPPIKEGWSPQLNPSKKRSCLNLEKFYLVGGTINAASDISIVILPQPVIWHLQLSLKRKIGLGLIFLVGLLACASSIVRLYNTVLLSQHDADISYLNGKQNIWAVAETTCGVLAVCLPISPKFFRSIQNSKFWSVLRTSLRSLTRSRIQSTRSRIQSTRIPDTRSEKAESAMQSNGSRNPKVLFRKYNVPSSRDIELKSTSDDVDDERIVRHDLELGSTSNDVDDERTVSYNH